MADSCLIACHFIAVLLGAVVLNIILDFGYIVVDLMLQAIYVLCDCINGCAGRFLFGTTAFV